MNEPQAADDVAAVGARVRHHGHQWPAAYRHGTATIVQVKPGWKNTSEYVVLLDNGETQQWNSGTTAVLSDGLVACPDCGRDGYDPDDIEEHRQFCGPAQSDGGANDGA